MKITGIEIKQYAKPLDPLSVEYMRIGSLPDLRE